MKSAARIFLPRNRIEALVRRPGGIPREKAIARAVKAVEELRDESIEGIRNGIESMETLIGASVSGCLTVREMRDVLRFADRIILLSEMFGFPVLALLTMRLCDLVERLIETGRGDTEVIRICVRTLHLVAPSNLTVGEKDSDMMLREISRILLHYGVRSENSFAI